MVKENLIVFDIDGTITDTVLIHQRAFQEALFYLGVPKYQPNLNSYLHHTDSFIAKSILESNSDIRFNHSFLLQFEQELKKRIFNHQILEIKGALDFIQYITTETNFGICFATGSLFEPALYKLNSIGLQIENSLLVSSNELWDRESIIQQAITNAQSYYHQSHFNTIISFGDGLWDLKAAQNLNLGFVGIGNQNKDAFVEHHVNCFAEDFTQINFSKIHQQLSIPE
jgi:phosphoglycolate phosphatase-like HAD superfamily hydrolase